MKKFQIDWKSCYKYYSRPQFSDSCPMQESKNMFIKDI